MFGWTAKDASTYQCRTPPLVAPKIRGKSTVLRRYSTRWRNLAQSCTSGSHTRIVRKAIATAISGLTRLATNSALATTVWKAAFSVVHANVGQKLTRAGPSFSFLCTKSYIRRSRDVTRREPQHHTNPQNWQKHRDHGGRAALLSSDVELMDQCDPTCGRPVHGVGRGRGLRINVENY
jgi:hypothetical protein